MTRTKAPRHSATISVSEDHSSMKVARVYVAKSEVKEMIRREVRKLEEAE
jgi:hypothetical protein